MFKNNLGHNLRFISGSVCQETEFASKYQCDNAFAVSYKQYYVRVCISPCPVPAQALEMLWQFWQWEMTPLVLQNTSARRSTAKKCFPKGNNIIYVLLHCKFSVMDAGINFGDVMLSSWYWDKSSLRKSLVKITLVTQKPSILNEQGKGLLES